jgi:hypothetical protein
MIRRMANGERVLLDEIASAYRHVHGTDWESTQWGAGWFPCVQASYDRAHRTDGKL